MARPRCPIQSRSRTSGDGPTSSMPRTRLPGVRPRAASRPETQRHLRMPLVLGGHHDRPVAVPAFDDAFGGKARERLADGHPRDAEPGCKLDLARQQRTRWVSIDRDVVSQGAGDASVPGDRMRLNGPPSRPRRGRWRAGRFVHRGLRPDHIVAQGHTGPRRRHSAMPGRRRVRRCRWAGGKRWRPPGQVLKRPMACECERRGSTQAGIGLPDPLHRQLEHIGDDLGPGIGTGATARQHHLGRSGDGSLHRREAIATHLECRPPLEGRPSGVRTIAGGRQAQERTACPAVRHWRCRTRQGRLQQHTPSTRR